MLLVSSSFYNHVCSRWLRCSLGAYGTLVTVFQSEVYAILMCSENCRDLRLQNKTICLCSDSRASLLALSSYTISSSIVSQCWLSLQELSSDNRVRLYWVPRHCDINGNGKADDSMMAPTFVDRNRACHYQLLLPGKKRKSGRTTRILVFGSRVLDADSPNSGLLSLN
jgi:hypothetical protein